MGFFSFKCSKSNVSIPAYPAARLPIEASQVVLVLPDNTRVQGVYNGYGCVNGVDVYAKLALHMFGVENRDLIWDGVKRVYKGKKLLGSIKAYMWDEVINVSHIVTMESHKLNGILGKTMNEIASEGYKLVTTYDHANKLIKIVRADQYAGENFEELKTSKCCASQGYFYSAYARKKIMLAAKKLGNV